MSAELRGQDDQLARPPGKRSWQIHIFSGQLTNHVWWYGVQSGHSDGMLDSIPTRFGNLDALLALATRHAISVAATPALLVLDDMHLRLGIAHISTGVVLPTERPTDRWVLLMRQIFPCDPYDDTDGRRSAGVLPVWAAAPRGVGARLRRASVEERKTAARLLLAAATWLVSQQYLMEERVHLAGRVYHRKPRPFAFVPTPAAERLWRVSQAHRVLLNHADPDQIDCLLQARYDAVLGSCHPGSRSRHKPSDCPKVVTW